MFGVIHSLEIIVIFFKRNCQYDSFHYINKQFIIYLYNQYKNGFSLINSKKNNLIFWRINGEKNYQNFKYARSYLYCMSWIRHTLELVLKYYICDSHCKILTFFSGTHMYLSTPYGLTCYDWRCGWRHLSMISAW